MFVLSLHDPLGRGTTKHENTAVVRAGIKPSPTQFQLAGTTNNENTPVVGAGFIPALLLFRGYRRWAWLNGFMGSYSLIAYSLVPIA